VADQAASPVSFDASNPRNPLTRARTDRLSSRVIAGFGLLFSAQVVPVLIQRLPSLAEPWAGILAGLMLATLVWVAIAAVLQRTVSLATTVFAGLYLVALATWPLFTTADAALLDARPWLWYLCTVATAYAAIGMPLVPAAAYTVLAPLLYGVVRGTSTGGVRGWESAALDSVYALVLGGVILVIVTMLRQAASSVDAAQFGALQRYARAVREHAQEAERVEVDAIVHDSVLTTLLAAANAHSPAARELAARMARDAIGHLNAPTEPIGSDEGSTDTEHLRERIAGAAASLSAQFSVDADAGLVAIPVHAGEALYAATVQAMVNSAQHAGDTGLHRRVRITPEPPTGVGIAVSDDGQGFDPSAVRPERLGLAVSIVERMARVGGVAEVRSAPGEGTTILLRWPAESHEGSGRGSAVDDLQGAENTDVVATSRDTETPPKAPGPRAHGKSTCADGSGASGSGARTSDARPSGAGPSDTGASGTGASDTGASGTGASGTGTSGAGA
jgi:Signal transduction histidine kinase